MAYVIEFLNDISDSFSSKVLGETASIWGFPKLFRSTKYFQYRFAWLVQPNACSSGAVTSAFFGPCGLPTSAYDVREKPLARWHGHSGLGTPLAVKICRSFKIIRPPHAPICQVFKDSQKRKLVHEHSQNSVKSREH